MMTDRGPLVFSESLALKIVSLILALILWVTILGFKPEERKKEVKLEPLLAPGVMITNKIPSHIQVTLSGPRIVLHHAEKALQPIRPNLRKTRDTTIGLSITEDLLGQLGSGVRVTNINPQNILIRLEPVEEKYITVRPTLRGQVASGFEMSSIKVTPSQIAVSGPRSLLEDLEYVGTEIIDITELRQPKEEVASVEVDTDQGFQLSREKVVRVKIVLKKVR